MPIVGQGGQLKIRLFLEGIEVPVISAQIISQPNAPAQAAIQIPPASLATRLLPRTVVHLFFADPYEATNPFVTFRGPDQRPTQQEPTAHQKQLQDAKDAGVIVPEEDANFAADSRNVKYKLLFGGEVVGFQWTKTPTNRSIVLQCVDFSNYWDYAYQFNNTDLFGPGLKAVFSGGSTNLLTDFLSSPGEIIAGLLHQKSAQYPGIPGLLSGLIRILEAIGGSYFYDNKFQGQNVFFSLAELRLRITQMITAFPSDNTAAKLMNSGGYDGLFGRTLGNLGEQVSIRSVLKALMGVIFHETYPITTPYYVPGTGGSQSGSVRKKIKNVPEYYSIYAGAALVDDALTDMTNIILGPAQPGATPLQGDPKKNKTQFLIRLTNMKRTLNDARLLAQQLRLKEVNAPLTAAITAMSVAITKVQKTWSPGMYPNQKHQEILKAFGDAQEELHKIDDMEVETVAKAKRIPARLNTQIFKPDIWFGPPPRCNVLFPDHYFQLQYQRSFLAEPTRFLLKTHNEFFGEDELFDNFYFAPKARTVKAQKKTLQALFENDIMTHELFTGILPVFEKMGEMNIFAVRSGTVNGKNPKVGLAQRSTNFLYFKHRFASRQMAVAARFNPYLACGFPCLVIDKYVSPEAAARYQGLLISLKKTSIPEFNTLLGTHFVGSIMELTHNVSAQDRQGTTSIRFAFPREFNEITEFFGPEIAEDQVVQKRFGESVRSTVVAALSPPPVGALGPAFGQIVHSQDVTKDYSNPDPQTAYKFPLWLGPRRSGTGQLKVEVPVGPTLPAVEYGPEVVALVGGPDRPVRFNAYKVFEQVPRYRREIVDLPAEELIRPGWYSDVWHPSKIGEAYFYYLGTGSITDKTQISDPGGLPNNAQQTGNPNADEVDALAALQKTEDGNDPKFSSAVALLTLDKEASTEQAVSFLLMTYSYVKSAGLDIDEFIKAYTWRPIATMVDMFGTSDFALDESGEEAISGIEGFHSRAFGPFNNLFGLVTPEITEILGIKRAAIAAQRGDVRGRRYVAVVDLVNSLQLSRANVG